LIGWYVPISLKSADAKLGRAEYHAKTVEDEIGAWRETKPYSISYRTNANSTRYSAIFRAVSDPPIEKWSLAIADSIHNFRCALDHLIYAAAVAESTDPPPHADSLMFPICDTNEAFRRDVKKHRLGNLSAPVRAVVELFQPYNRPYPKLPPILSMLRDFENANKHKLLQVLFTAVNSGNVGFTGPLVAPGTNATFWANKGELKDGAEIGAVIFDRPTPNMRFDRFECIVVFALTHKRAIDGIGDRDDCIALMYLIADEVKRIINSVSAAVG
jgi:hypothetical protein